jgi:RND family efflux transporter MFP subunit
MKKIIFTLFISVFLFSCSTEKTPETPDEIKNRINEYRSQVKELNRKIADLNKKLELLEKGEAQVNAVKVNTLEIKPSVFKHYFMATGAVEAIDEAYISPQTTGQIEKIFVEEGDMVKKGQLLAKLDTKIIENNIKEVETGLELAKVTYEKQKELWDKKIGSEIQYLQAKNKYESLQSRLETLRSQYDLSFIKSPINGYVDDVAQKTGEIASPGRVLFHIVDLKNLLVKAKVSEVYLPVISKGDKITITFSTLPGRKINTRITRIGQVINPGDRTFSVEARINNKNNKIKPNMLASILINDYTAENAISVPSFVIREDMKGYYLYVVKEGSGVARAEKRYVETGKSYKGNTEIVKGLEPGDRVITDGYNNVSGGQQIVYR